MTKGGAITTDRQTATVTSFSRLRGPRRDDPLADFYLDNLVRLADLMDGLDLSVPNHFHKAMWLIMNGGGNQAAFAERHGYRPATVSRWVNGSKAPPLLRRAPIARDALRHLQEMVANGVPVPVRVITDDVAPPAPRRAGRPVRR